VSLGKARNEIASTFKWIDWYSNRWQLDLKTEKVTSLSSGGGTLTNKINEYLNLTILAIQGNLKTALAQSFARICCSCSKKQICIN